MAERRTVRYYRQELAELAQRVSDLRSPITEGYQHPPAMVGEGLGALERFMDDLDRDWAKVDRRGPLAALFRTPTERKVLTDERKTQ